jgi:hypothetical protein
VWPISRNTVSYVVAADLVDLRRYHSAEGRSLPHDRRTRSYDGESLRARARASTRGRFDPV